MVLTVSPKVGGSYPDSSLADITLTWLISNLSPFLAFDTSYLMHLYDVSDSFSESPSSPLPLPSHDVSSSSSPRSSSDLLTQPSPTPPTRSYATGKIYNSSSGAQALLGSEYRTPGNSHATSPKTGKPLPRLLEATNESIHPSVRLRIEQDPAGIYNKGKPRPRALQGWQIVGEPGNYRWVSRDGYGIAHKRIVLGEDLLGKEELVLLRRSLDVARLYDGDEGLGA